MKSAAEEQRKQKEEKLKKKKSTLFNKVTHLYFQDKRLQKIPQLSNAQEVQTLYLYNNYLTKIEHFDDLTNLSSLYLQSNHLQRLENMKNLKKLKKLYVGKNKIGVLEGLDCIEALEELHIEKQELVDNTPLCFDPRTIFSLANSLKVLNISHNKIPSLTFLSPLQNLEILDASYNDLDDIKDVTQTLRKWYYLKEAKFMGNPISKKHRYREDIIASTYCLNILDDKKISDLSRNFIRRFEEGKLIFGKKEKINLADIVPGLPSNYPKTLQKAASASIIKGSRFKLLNDLTAFDDAEPVHISWNLLPKRKPLVQQPSKSLLRGHKMESQKNILISKSNIKQRRDY